MIKIGITGIIGSGKSKVSKIFEIIDIPVYYADNEAKKLIIKDQKIISKLKNRYGENIYTKDGALNKKLLSEIIFKNKSEREFVNKIVHPVVVNDFLLAANNSKKDEYAIESALVSESNLTDKLDIIINVKCSNRLRLERIMQRDGISQNEAKQRIDAQNSDDFFSSLSDYTILNDEKNSLIEQTLEIIKKIR